jgi:hypothetical protein
MLTRKNLLILAVVVVVLMAVSVWQNTRHEARTSRASSVALLADEYARADLARLEIGHGDDDAAVVLEAGEPRWTVATAYDVQADHNKIDTLLRSLSGLRGEFRSESADVLADYGFTDTTTVTIRGFDAAGDEVLAIDVGDKPGGGRGNFVRRPGDDAVYLTTASLLGNLGLWSGPGEPQDRHFIDLLAFQAERDSVAAMVIAGDETLELAKEFVMIEPAPDDTVHAEPYPDPENWEWRLADGALAKKTTGDTMLGSATRIRAQDVADPSVDLAAYGLDPARRTVTLEYRNGDEATVLRFGDERPAEGSTPGGYYAMFGDDPTVWVVGTYTAENIFKSRDEVLPD